MLLYSPSAKGKVTEGDIALNIAARRRRRLAPAAVDLAAACLYRFHRTINGSLSPALKSRPQSVARRMSHGIRCLTIEDIAELVTTAGPHKATARAAVRELLTPILDHFEVDAPRGLLLGEAVADFTQASAAVGSAFIRGKDRTQLLDELGRVEGKAHALRHVLRTTAVPESQTKASR